MLHATWKSLLSRKLRLALTAFAVVLGVAFVSGTFILTDTLRRSFDELFAASRTAADLSVAGLEREGAVAPPARVPPALVEQLAGLEGVAAVSPAVEGFAQLVVDGEPVGGQGPPTVGLAVPRAPELGDLQLTQGTWPTAAAEVAIDANTAEEEGLAPGDTVEWTADGPVRQATITGLVSFGQSDAFTDQLTFTVFDAATALEVLTPDGTWSSVDIDVAPDADADAVAGRIEAVAGPEFEVLTVEEAASRGQADAETFLGFFTTGLLVFAGVSLFVGAFIIYNTFSIIVAQRTRELALLRAVGAGRRQVVTSVLTEAAVVGLIGGAVGLGLGFAVAFGLRALLAAFAIELPEGDLVFAWRTVLVGIAVGVGVTVASAVPPALKAVRVPPVAALQAVAVPPPPRGGRLRSAAGVLLGVVGVVLLVTGLSGAGIEAVGGGAVLVILAAAMLSQFVTKPALSVIGWPARRAGLTGQLAQENAQRAPRRTASTASALMIGLGLVAFALIFGASVRASVSQALDDAFVADLQLASSNFGPLPEGASDAVAALDEVRTVAPLEGVTIAVDGDDPSLAVGVDASALADTLTLDVPDGALAALDDTGIAVEETTARERALEVGAQVPVTFPDGVRDLQVVATFVDSGALSSDYLVSAGLARSAAAEPGQLGALIRLEPGVDAAAGRDAVAIALAAYPTVDIQDSADIEEQVAGGVNQLLGLLSGLLGLSIIIALFGIVNTLSLSVFERTRELGLLRAVGASRRQVRAMVRWEAVLTAVLGALLGLVVGVLFGWLAVRALADQGLGTFSIPVVQLLLGLGAAALAGILAAILPARRAARTDILRALAVE